MRLGVRGWRGWTDQTSGQWLLQSLSGATPSGHEAGSYSIPGSPTLRGPRQERCPQGHLQEESPFRDLDQVRGAAQLPLAPGRNPRPHGAPSAFPENRKRSGKWGCKNRRYSQSGQDWSWQASRLPSSEGWARRAQPGRNACRTSLLSGFPDASWAPSPGRHMYGPQGLWAGAVIHGAGHQHGFCAPLATASLRGCWAG